MYRLLAYLFPFVLIVIEYGLRFALKTDTAAFVGPALSTAAAGLLVPSLALKSKLSTLTPELQNELKRLGVTVRSKADERVVALSLLLLLFFIAAWIWTLVLAERKDDVTILTLDRPVFIGLLCYVVAVVAAEFKEIA